MNGSFKLPARRWFPWLILALAFAALVVAYKYGDPSKDLSLLVTLLGAVGGVGAFFYARHLSDTDLFSRLFDRFNERYDKLNSELARIDRDCRGGSDLTRHDCEVLVDYFNLCAEEHLYYTAGYIDQTVWNSWLAGMRIYASVPAIRALWEKELASESYYRFQIDLLR
jgi:hypothetical protein